MTTHTIEFTAASGNRVVANLRIEGQRAAAAADWEKRPTPDDIEEASAFIGSKVAEILQSDCLITVFGTADKEQRQAMLDRHLFGSTLS